MYIEEDKYSGQPDDSFNFKLGIFVENCKKARVLPEARGLAISVMLTGLVKDYYYKVCRNYDDIDLVCDTISNWFETEEQGQTNLLNWEILTLDDIIQENPDKRTAQYLNILIQQITTIQCNLLLAYHNDKILCDKLINVYRSNEACKFAYYKAGNTLSAVINDLQASIIMYKRPKKPGVYYKDHSLKPDDEEADAYYTDRKYRGPSRNPSKFRLKQ